MLTDFQLGDWLVRPHRDRIECGSRMTHVKPKTMAVLLCLAQANGRVVDRQVFFETIWPGGVVTDDVLTQCIVELRKAFGDSARHPRIIETIPKIGFRLIPAVVPRATEKAVASSKDLELRPMPDKASPRKPARRAIFLVTGVTVTVLLLGLYLSGFRVAPVAEPRPGTNSIAVMPFVDMTEDQELGWYADGLTEGIINRLAQLEGFYVVSRTSSFQFRGRNLDLRRIGEDLGVNYLLEGSVSHDESHLRVTAQLIDSENGFHIWSSQYDELTPRGNKVQESITNSVATALSIKSQTEQAEKSSADIDRVEDY